MSLFFSNIAADQLNNNHTKSSSPSAAHHDSSNPQDQEGESGFGISPSSIAQAAATKIQATFRGFLTRKELANQRKKVSPEQPQAPAKSAPPSDQSSLPSKANNNSAGKRKPSTAGQVQLENVSEEEPPQANNNQAKMQEVSRVKSDSETLEIQ